MRSIVFCNVFSALQWCAAINHPAEFGPDFIVFLGTSVVSSYSYQGHRPRRTQTKDQCGPWCLGQVLGVFHGSPPKGPVGGLPLKTVKSADCVDGAKYSNLEDVQLGHVQPFSVDVQP